MSRTHPKILLEHVDKSTYKSLQVVEATGIWTVCYNGLPFNLKNQHYLDNQSVPKYKKTSFSNPGHAFNLCKKLNTLFKSENFTVVLMSSGNVVYPKSTHD